MQSTVFFRMLCRLLIVSLLAMPFSPAMAGMIGTDEALAASTAQANRANTPYLICVNKSRRGGSIVFGVYAGYPAWIRTA